MMLGLLEYELATNEYNYFLKMRSVKGARMYLVTYDLHKPEKDYKSLIDTLESYPDHLHVLASTWLLATTSTAQQIYDRLRPQMDRDDHILVIKVSNDKQGWLPEESWKWINSSI